MAQTQATSAVVAGTINNVFAHVSGNGNLVNARTAQVKLTNTVYSTQANAQAAAAKVLGAGWQMLANVAQSGVNGANWQVTIHTSQLPKSVGIAPVQVVHQALAAMHAAGVIGTANSQYTRTQIIAVLCYNGVAYHTARTQLQAWLQKNNLTVARGANASPQATQAALAAVLQGLSVPQGGNNA